MHNQQQNAPKNKKHIEMFPLAENHLYPHAQSTLLLPDEEWQAWCKLFKMSNTVEITNLIWHHCLFRDQGRVRGGYNKQGIVIITRLTMLDLKKKMLRNARETKGVWCWGQQCCLKEITAQKTEYLWQLCMLLIAAAGNSKTEETTFLPS